MKRLTIFASAAVLSLLFSFSIVESVYATPGMDPNVIRRMSQRNFRRPVGEMERYRRNKRSLERRTIDQFTTASGSLSTFDRREDYLRATQLKRIQEDLDARQYSGVRRPLPRLERTDRSEKTTIRRIGEARRGGGIRLRRGTASLRQTQGLSSDEKAARIAEYRQRIRDAETTRYNAVSNDCSNLSGRRRAQCYYRLRQD